MNPIGILLLRLIIQDWIAISEFIVLSQNMLDFIVCLYKHSVGTFLIGFVIALSHSTKILPKRSLNATGIRSTFLCIPLVQQS
jgi:hypothetical protein